MNVVTFNDRIKEMTLKSHPAIQKLTNLFPGWETSPLFMYDEPSNEAEATAIIAAYESTHSTELFEHTPFPVFRLDINVGETDKPEYGRYKAKALVANYPDGLAIFARADHLLHTKATYPFKGSVTQRAEDKWLPLYMFMHQVHLSPNTRDGKADFTCSADAMFGISGKWLMGSDLKNLQPLASNYFNGLLKSIAAFNVSANSPNNHIAEVIPDQEHRSVEWKKARTHYTLITHGHPANNASVQHGSKVVVDPTEELTRIAHNRRAHQRTLRAARFRYARGKTIWVKATWVGPKEWRDEGGKQIYRILEPVAEAKVA